MATIDDQINNLAIAADLAELTARRYGAIGNMAAAAECLRDADDCLKQMWALNEGRALKSRLPSSSCDYEAPPDEGGASLLCSQRPDDPRTIGPA